MYFNTNMTKVLYGGRNKGFLQDNYFQKTYL